MIDNGSVIGYNNSTTFYNYIMRSRTGSKTGNTEETSYCSNYINKNLKNKFNQLFIHNKIIYTLETAFKVKCLVSNANITLSKYNGHYDK